MIRSNPSVTRRGLLASAAGLASLAGLAACGNSGSDDASAPAAAAGDGTPDATQEMNLVELNDLQTLDVNDIRNENEFEVLSELNEGLFRTFTDENGIDDVECAGCEDYEVSEDGLTYTFHLRDNGWSDGQPVVAQHYVDSILRLCNPDNGFSYAFLAEDIAGAAAYMNGEGAAEDIAVAALDDKTLEIRLANPIPFFLAKLSNVCFDPVRMDLINEYADTMSNDWEKQVYSGPFKITSRTLENSIVLEPNENYWDKDNVKLKKLTYTIVTEDATRTQLLTSRALDSVDCTSEYVNQWKELADQGQLVYNQKTDVGSDYLVFNHHTGGPSGLMNNAKCCLAISCCFNREDFNNTALSGLNLPAYGLIPFGILSGDVEYRSTYDEPLKALLEQYDTPEKCQELFREGVKEVTGSDDVSGVTLTILTQQTNTQAKNTTEWLAQQIGAGVGVTVNINAQSEAANFVTERDSNNYDFYLMGWNADFSDPISYFDLFATGSGYAKFMGGYSNAEYDEMYESLKTMADSEERTAVYQKMEQNIIENAGIAPVYYTVRHNFTQPYVMDLSLPQFGNGLEVSRSYISGKEA
ncbi:peptide ABC transporter substrate-binding protein [Olsenella profusa]|uniref:Peptide ABC transporter substrate-binding protein n=1 Tax=Olsenella profusa TaxID=138595 RepID=A0ABS2F2J1_9ACTN|nr:peptide ABC transporter substrate-binding protein [Olsenella profusa]MBM6774769.1 peptide ABC transporter substrate-binding protein [Olsenella profusa]